MNQPSPTACRELWRGLVPLLSATLGCGCGASSLVFYSLGVFVAPLVAEFGWSRGQVTSAMLYSSGGLVLAGPLLGLLVDRLGERRVVLWSVPAFACVLWLLSRLQGELWLFHAAFFAAAVLGSGTTPILYTRVIARHFDRARGLALGITLAGPGLAALLLPPWLNGLITQHGWRAGFLTLSLMAVLPLPLVWWGLGRTPAPLKPQQTSHAARAVLPDGALRLYLTLAVVFMASAAAASALVVHLVPLLRDAGLSAEVAARSAALIGVGILTGRLLIGWLIDRIHAPLVAIVLFLVAACGCLLLLFGGPPLARIAALLIGFALGAEVDLMAYLVSRYFGLVHYGLLYGSLYAGFWVGIAAGPALAGWLFDADGNYHRALWLLTVLFVLAALAASRLPRFTSVTRPA